MKHVRVITVLIALAVVVLFIACPNPTTIDGEDLDPVDPGTLLQIPDDATPSSGGPGIFFAVISDLQEGSVSLITSSAASPAELVTIVDADISPAQWLVRLSDDSNKVAYVNILDQLIIHDRPSGDSYIVRSYSEGADNMDEFWWYGDDALLFSSDGSISRAKISETGLLVSPVTGSEVCHHDLAQNPFSAFPGGIGIALTYITESATSIWIGKYMDGGEFVEVENGGTIETYDNGFDIGFDPMLTWLSEDVLIWRTGLSVSSLWFWRNDTCDAEEVYIDNANTPAHTDFLLSSGGDTIYLFGHSNVVTSLSNPAIQDTYDADVFYVDSIEYTVSKLAFSPSGNYFLVGNRSRVRCFDAADPSVRYRWWEDTELEQRLNDVSLELLQIWWK